MKKAVVTIKQLLAVLVIMLVVAAILFPIFGKARECAGCTNCGSNEHQIGMAIAQWSQDNNEQMPNIAELKNKNVTWRTMIYPYAKSTDVFLCPSRNETTTKPGQKFNTPDGLPQSYAANYTGSYSGKENDRGNGAFGGPGAKNIRVQDIHDPSSLIMLCEVWHHATPDFNIDNLGAFHSRTDTLWAGHENGSFYLFADGHVKYLAPLGTQALWHRDDSIPLSEGSVKVLQNAHLGKENR